MALLINFFIIVHFLMSVVFILT